MNRELFAAFIMTYERPVILDQTIRKIFAQSLAPAKILVIDNGSTENAKRVVEALNDSRIEYLRVGYNAGPAGAAEIGLKQLVDEGYEWIYWCDDDDPPLFEDTLETLLQYSSEDPKIGITGAVGQFFNFKRGRVVRVADELLFTKKDQLIDVDVIAGNMCIIVHRRVIEAGILPNPAFFLNVEEYDYCLRTKEAGFRVVVPTGMFLRYRQDCGHIGKALRPTPISPTEKDVWRRYYSIRNLLYVLLYNEKRFLSGAFFATLRALAKAFYYLFQKNVPGIQNFKMELLGIYHGWTGKMGKRVSPVPKY